MRMLNENSCLETMNMSYRRSMRELENFINGEFVQPDADTSFDVINPATEAVIASAPVTSAAQVDQAFQVAQATFDESWSDTTPQERSVMLWRLADEMERRADDFADAESLDTGKPRKTLVEDEISASIDQIRFFAGAARNLEGRGAAEYMRDHTSYVRREPIGVVGQVTPWNYPLNMAVWKIAPAIAAGNTTVLKPSDTTPLSTLLLAEISQGILPPGVLNVVLGDRGTGEALTTHPIPQLVAITGSVRAGIEVARSAASQVKRVHLELGGKAPAIIFPDADLELAVEHLMAAGYFNAGQDCTAATRILVHESIHDEFVAAFTEYVRNHATTGTPDEDVFYGAINNRTQFENVSRVLETLPDHANIAIGGERQGDTGYFMQATVLTNMRQDDAAVQTEIFGPVLTVQSFTSEAQALEYANGVQYALAASVWTRDHGTAMRMTRKLDFGCVWVNAHIPFISEMPHGGFKHSGYGKDLSMYGFEDYTRVKHVMHYIGDY